MSGRDVICQGIPIRIATHMAGGFFSANIGYRSEFMIAPGLRPHLRMEMTFEPPALPPIERP
jgi:hypothetical protein